MGGVVSWVQGKVRSRGYKPWVPTSKWEWSNLITPRHCNCGFTEAMALLLVWSRVQGLYRSPWIWELHLQNIWGALGLSLVADWGRGGVLSPSLFLHRSLWRAWIPLGCHALILSCVGEILLAPCWTLTGWCPASLLLTLYVLLLPWWIMMWLLRCSAYRVGAH